VPGQQPKKIRVGTLGGGKNLYKKLSASQKKNHRNGREVSASREGVKTDIDLTGRKKKQGQPAGKPHKKRGCTLPEPNIQLHASGRALWGEGEDGKPRDITWPVKGALKDVPLKGGGAATNAEG